VPPEQAPDDPQVVEIDFQSGNPVAVDGISYPPAELIKTLNKIAGKHGIGRIDMVENRFVGMKSRGIYETPGGTVLHLAHRDLEGICMDREAMHIRDSLIPKYAQMVYNGFWYAPEREALQAMIDSGQTKVTGTVRIKLYKGQAYPLGRKSQYSLYNPAMATFEEDDVYDQADAAGFIRLQGLRLLARQSQKD
jgi:argininosuccinate synthase